MRELQPGFRELPTPSRDRKGAAVHGPRLPDRRVAATRRHRYRAQPLPHGHGSVSELYGFTVGPNGFVAHVWMVTPPTRSVAQPLAPRPNGPEPQPQ